MVAAVVGLRIDSAAAADVLALTTTLVLSRAVMIAASFALINLAEVLTHSDHSQLNHWMIPKISCLVRTFELAVLEESVPHCCSFHSGHFQH